MPNRDGTGPLGQGPLTGRGLGRCNPRPPKETPEQIIPTPTNPNIVGRGRGGVGRGLGLGRGRGLGRFR